MGKSDVWFAGSFIVTVVTVAFGAIMLSYHITDGDQTNKFGILAAGSFTLAALIALFTVCWGIDMILRKLERST